MSKIEVTGLSRYSAGRIQSVLEDEVGRVKSNIAMYNDYHLKALAMLDAEYLVELVALIDVLDSYDERRVPVEHSIG